MRTCAHCGGEISAEKRSVAKFCSVRCRNASRPRVTSPRSCLRCGNALPVERIGTRATFCSRACKRAEDHRRYRERYPEKVRQHARRNYQNHREEKLAYGAQWKKENPEKSRAASSRWRKRNPEKVAEQKRRYFNSEGNIRRQRRCREKLAIEAIDLMNDIKEKTS